MKMNDREFASKVNRDTGELKDDVSTMMDDGKTGLGRIEDRTLQAITRAKAELTSWVEEGTAQFSRKLENLVGDARDTVVVTAKTVQQDVDLGLGQYNTKVQELVNKAPGGFSKKAARYPWVTITVSMAFGLMVGLLLKPTRQPLG